MTAVDPIRVMVIDDSAFSRRTITRMLESSPLIEVVDFARDGEEALRKALENPVDLITLDLEMPRMDGFTFLRILMAKHPTPVIVISGRADDQDVFKALDLGAVDFVAKPTSRATPELATIEAELVRRVLAVQDLRIDKVRDRIAHPPTTQLQSTPCNDLALVAIGASTGGPAALSQLFGSFSEPPPFGFAVAQHMPEGFTRGFAARLDRLTCFDVREARHGDEPRPGQILLAPGGSHMEFEALSGRVVTRLAPRTGSDKYAPSVDRLFHSCAKHFGADLLAVVLTGMGDDGTRGARRVKEAGGNVIAESEESAVIFGMPKQAISAGAVDAVLPLRDIPGAIQAGVENADERPAEDRG